MAKDMRLVIVGFSQTGHVGSYLAFASRQLGLDSTLIDAGLAEAQSRIGQIFHWRARGKRPGRLSRFAARAVAICREIRPDLVLTTGRAPLERSHIEEIQALGVMVVNYSTDDPWNPKLCAPWFLSTLSAYDAIFTTRRANLDDFRRCGVKAVHYLPFGYDLCAHRPWPPGERAGKESDILFVGGCDEDRLPLIGSLIDAGLNLALFGGYWNRYEKTRSHWRGMAEQAQIRADSAAARICLCLVRRANRDGHVMRSYEAGAIGGCILAEDTADHRELFSDTVRYFKTPEELVGEAKKLLNDVSARRCLTLRLRERMTLGSHTYADRLATIIQLAGIHCRGASGCEQTILTKSGSVRMPGNGTLVI